MHALRLARRSLARRGAVLALHPCAAWQPVESHGAVVGRLDAREFARTVRGVEAALDRLVAEGLFERVHRDRVEVLEHFDDAETLLETVAGWQGTRTPPRLAAAVRRAAPPFQVRLPLSLALLRAIDAGDESHRELALAR